VPWFLIRAVPCFLAIYFGSGLIEKILTYIPKTVLTGLTVSSGLVPAVGICVLLLMLLKGSMWLFFLLGFVLTTYLKLPIIPVTFIALAFAAIYDLAINKNNAVNTGQKNEGQKVPFEGGYDL
jgi:PTS system mannose-specific IIC component